MNYLKLTHTKYLLCLCLLLTQAYTAHAQLDTLVFTASYFKTHKIRTLQITPQLKRDNERIINRNQVYNYVLDTLGRVVQKTVFTSIAGTTIKDTSVIHYGYDRLDRLYMQRNFDHHTITTQYTMYNANSTNQKNVTVLETIDTTMFPIKVLTQQPTDSSFIKNETVSTNSIRSTYYNSYRLPYFSLTTETLPNSVSYTKQFNVTSLFEKYTIQRLANKIEATLETSNSNGYNDIKTIYTYGGEQLKQQIVFVNNIQNRERFLFYENELIVNEITKYAAHKNMDIVTYHYQFYK